MPFSHAVVWIGHVDVHVIQFLAQQAVDQRVKQRVHFTRQHGDRVRGQHEFFGEVCEALVGIRSVLVVGHREPQTAFRQYVSKHRPALALHIAGWVTLDRPTEPEVLKLAREFFASQGAMVATPRVP
jgi:hypothetical protein